MKIYFPIILYIVTALTLAINLWTTDANQQRPQMIEHQALMNAAQWKAEYIESTGHFAHCTEDGECPNKTIKRFGCNTTYSPNGNSVESLVWGTANAQIAYQSLIDSPSHKIHMLALIPFFQEQIHFGVGHSNLTFVFITAKCL